MWGRVLPRSGLCPFVRAMPPDVRRGSAPPGTLLIIEGAGPPVRALPFVRALPLVRALPPVRGSAPSFGLCPRM
jgi:hypothetical protein